MTKKRNLAIMAIAFGVALAMLPLGAQKKADWKSFSNKDFEIGYPEGWRASESAADFTIVSPPPARSKGSPAEIVVRKKSAEMSTLDEAVKGDSEEGRLLQKTELRGPALIESRCGRLYKTVRRMAVGAKAGEIYTSYYCVNSKGTFELTLSNAQGDPRHRALQQTAKDILATLKPE